jgi:hypothetical protein
MSEPAQIPEVTGRYFGTLVDAGYYVCPDTLADANRANLVGQLLELVPEKRDATKSVKLTL